MVRMSNELPRVKRSVTKRLAQHCCPLLVAKHCQSELARKAHSPGLRARSKTRDHWLSEARALCCEAWGFPSVPGEVVAAIDEWVAAWRGEEPGPKKQRTLSALFETRRGS